MQADSNSRLPGVKSLVFMIVSTVALATGAGVWFFQTSTQSIQVQARERVRSVSADGSSSRASPAGSETAAVDQTVNDLLRLMDVWMSRLSLATAVTGSGMLFTLLLGVGWWRRAWTNQVLRRQHEQEGHSQQLREASDEARRHKAARERLEREMRQLEAEVERRVQERTVEITRAREVLQKELNDRRQAERSLAHQRQELERSKDVLELHVQARTQQLRKLQHRYEHILNSAGEGIYGLDLEGRTTFVNPTAAKLTGWGVDELVGQAESEVFFHSEQASAATQPPGEGLNPGNEQVFHRQDGTTFPVEYTRTPIVENDKMVGAVVIFKDITERKRVEETLSRKAGELARSNAELEQFAYVASHDLQEPLRKIQSFGDRLRSKLEAAQLGEGHDYLERMQNAAARMQKLIADLLTFSRVISSAQPFVPVDLNLITREVLGDLEVPIERTKAQVEVGSLPTIEADPLQMRQLLQNLISNSLKFQPPDATPVVTIRAQVLKRPFSCAKNPTPDDEVCELTVQDNGIGFDEKYLERIFAVFQRLHGRTEYEGTGVGLAVCRRITDRHGGTIMARGRPGEGATFAVTLPVRQANGENTK